MNEIVICGNEQQRSEIRCRLKPCDANLHFMNFCEEEMLSEEILSKGAIWIAADDLQERMLLEAGVCEGEIINYKRFEKTTYENPIAAFACDDDEYTGLIFGMSHSQCAIDESLFTNETYCKVAAPSLDLFLQRRFMEKLSIEHPAALKKIRHIIIELPYYIFNYDLSRFGSFVYTKLKYFEIVGDYHHFGKTEEQQLRISEFNHFLNLFYSEKCNSDRMKKKNFALRILKSLHRKYRIATNSDKVWHSVYEETVEENIEHWNCLKELISAYCPSAKITVLIMPFNPIFRLFHRRQIKFMRQRFLSALGKGNFQICDHFALFKRDRYFDDHCHLNERGAHRYTTFLKKILGS